ncbi:NAD(P)H-hydrate epimerase [Myceligenerans halotolerans]
MTSDVGAVQAFTTGQVQGAVSRALSMARSDDQYIRKAGYALAGICLRELRRRHGSVRGRRVVLLAGAGNNGADAMVAGRDLREHGVVVRAVATSGRVNAISTRWFGHDVVDATTPGGLRKAHDLLADADLVIDGIVGDAARGGLRAPADELVAAIPSGAVVVAVDLPSGVDPDTGRIPGAHVQADVTVSFVAHKPCLILPPAAGVVGRVEFVDVGFGHLLPTAGHMRRLTARGVADRWPVPTGRTHKFSRGMLGVVAGSDAFPGAAVLVCQGAHGTGTGVLRYTGPRSVGDLLLVHVPEAERRSDPIAAEDDRLRRAGAWVLGSGVTGDEEQDRNILAALDTGLPAVVDAGALDPCVSRRAAGDRPTPGSHLLVTPHAGEAARMLKSFGRDVTSRDVDAAPWEHASMLAKEADATVLLKGATTIVVGPDGRTTSQAEAPPWLATGGAGDVLAGIAGALLASGLDAMDAGAIAAFVHGRAAALAADGGPIRASDVARHVPAAVREILELREQDAQAEQVRRRAARTAARALARAAVRAPGPW